MLMLKKNVRNERFRFLHQTNKNFNKQRIPLVYSRKIITPSKKSAALQKTTTVILTATIEVFNIFTNLHFFYSKNLKSAKLFNALYTMFNSIEQRTNI